MTVENLSEDFYEAHAQRYAQVTHNFTQSVYTSTSHPGLTSDLDLMVRLKELIPPGGRGLDAGCGAGARDVFYYWRDGYNIVGVDVREENIRVARELHPEIADRVSVADLSRPLDYPGASFDFVLCNAVIQHISPEMVMGVTLPELARVLKMNGGLQLMFKVGSGIQAVYDRDYDTERTFQLYQPEEVISLLVSQGLEVIPPDGDKLGGVIHFTDPKPVDHCVFYARKVRYSMVSSNNVADRARGESTATPRPIRS